MAMKRVTMQDIADACGLSRNTVSKIFNSRGQAPESTRQMVLNKARELGYGQVPDDTAHSPEPEIKSIALLTQNKLLGHSFGSYFFTSFSNCISRSGFTMKMYAISSEEIADGSLPPHLDLETTAGILCIELFDRPYLEMISSLGLPCALVDGFACAHKTLLSCDFITMENYSSTVALTEHLLATGVQRIGFVGDKDHCNSFFERWLGFASALVDHGMQPDETFCILDKDDACYGNIDWLVSKLQGMPSLPDAFVCANDYLAIHLIAALKKMELRIPEDIMVTGFDGSPEAALIDPPLTTAKIFSEEIGKVACETLIGRINDPQRPSRWISVISTPVWGKTTR